MNSLTRTCLSAALLLGFGQAFAAGPVTVGVGHMCCGACKASATQALAKVAEGVKIEGDAITLTAKSEDLLPTLDALRKGGFPAKSLLVSGPVTLGVAHLCCGGCRTGLSSALAAGKLPALDASATKVGENSVVVAPKAGMKLDLIPLIAAMEAGGFSPSKVTLGTATTKSAAPQARRFAVR